MQDPVGDAFWRREIDRQAENHRLTGDRQARPDAQPRPVEQPLIGLQPGLRKIGWNARVHTLLRIDAG